MKTVYSDRHRLHDPKVEFSGGRFVPGFEIPRRAEMVLARVEETRLGPVLAPEAGDVAAIARVHDDAFVEFLTVTRNGARSTVTAPPFPPPGSARPCAASCRTASAPASATTASTPPPP